MAAVPTSTSDMGASAASSLAATTPAGLAFDTALSHQTPQTTPQSSQARSVKRPRPVKSCTECRKRKLRCDRLLPCSQCQKSHRICRYSAEHDSSNLSDGSDVEVAEPQRSSKRNCLPPPAPSLSALTPDVALPPVARNGETVSVAVAVVEDLVSRLDRLEKQVLAKSPAGTEVSVPRSHLSVAASPETIRGITIKKGTGRTRFFGQNSSRVMLNLVRRTRHATADGSLTHKRASSTRPKNS
jgi:hypothetical protein